MTHPAAASKSDSPGTVSEKIFRLTPDVIIQLLGDEQFYLDCVAYFWLRRHGLEASRRYANAIRSRNMQGYVRGDDTPRIFAPILGSFLQHTSDLHAANPDLLLPLWEYLVAKLGYRPAAILISYKQGTETQEILLQ